MRSLVRGAPELSRLVVESPVDLTIEYLSHARFAVLLSEPLAAVSQAGEDQVRRDAITAALKNLKPHRTNRLEFEARRVMQMTDTGPEAMLRRLGEDSRFAATQGLRAQRDEVARSLWAYLQAYPLFEAAERAMQVRAQREHVKLYEMWSIDASIALAADGVDHEALSAEIAGRPQHEDGCRVEAIDLPADNGQSHDVLVAITFFGAYSSQKNVRPDKSTETLYFRPPNELLLVYSQSRRCIEICSCDMVERKLVANIFAAETLKHDVSNKPLTQKTYNLSRFRTSLKLPIPDREADRVRRANVTEVQVALGDWSRKVSLGVAPLLYVRGDSGRRPDDDGTKQRDHRRMVLRRATILLGVTKSEIPYTVSNQHADRAELVVPIDAMVPER